MVIDTFEDRVRQILTGDTAMNCQMCKYRTQVLGFESDVGAAQESHHHHVEGLSAIIKETARGKTASHNHGPSSPQTTTMRMTITIMITPMRPIRMRTIPWGRRA